MTVFPEHIGRYQPRAILGHGGMATVYRAYDPLVGREVALKVMKHALRHDPSYRARFEREVRAIAALEHSAIVPVYDFGEEAGQLYLVMRLMRGGSLAEMLEDGPLPLGRATAILQRIAPAIDEAHRQGIIHRDLKPANILFDAQGKAFLSDFGVAKVTRTIDRLTGSGIVGTPAYMSPEQIQGEEVVDGRSDIYGLGVILFKMLTGHNPFQAETPVQLMLKHVHDPVPQARNFVLDVPEPCEAIIARAMAKQREERYQSAQTLVTALTAVLHRQAGPVAPLPLPVEDSEAVAPVEDTPILSDPVAPVLSQSQIRYWQLDDRLVRIPLRRRPPLPDQVITIPEPPQAENGPAQASWHPGQQRRFEAEQGAREQSLQQRKIVYRQQLAILQQELEQLSNRQRQILRANDPPTAMLLRSGAQHPFWQRRPEEDDFLCVRVGEGALPASFRIVPPARATQSEEGQAALALVAQYGQVSGVPLTVDLRSAGALRIAADADSALLLANTILVNVAFHHTPEEVQIWVLSRHAEASRRWAWLKWLPHCGALDGGGGDSRLAFTPPRIQTLLTRLNHLLPAGRQHAPAGRRHPHLVIVGDHLDGTTDDLGVFPRFTAGGNITMIYLGAPQADGATALTVAPGGGLHLQRVAGDIGWKEGAAELTTAAEAERVARRLAPVQAVIAGVRAAEPPASVRLLKLLGAQRAAEVDMARLYRAAQIHADILAFPLGLNARREPLRGILDSGRGRLTVAGAAGSGRTQLLQALFLSLAAHYGPQHVHFVIVADEASHQALAPLQALPHTSAYCKTTDEDKLAGVVAALEVTRQQRERMREEAARHRQQMIPDLALYNYLHPAEVLPFLVVLIDGFRREFMAASSFDLTAIARQGPAAGIYLIAGSERPAGLPRVWRDMSQSRISCRLPTADDSYALFGRPDAATLPSHLPGRAYMQQREGEPLTLFQGAQASEPAAATQEIPLAQLPAFVISRIAADGHRERLYEHQPAPGTTAALHSDAAQLIATINDYCHRAGYAAASPLVAAGTAGPAAEGR